MQSGLLRMTTAVCSMVSHMPHSAQVPLQYTGTCKRNPNLLVQKARAH